MAMGRGGSSKLSRNKRTEAKKRKTAQQPMRTEVNRKRKLRKHLSLQPKDRQALLALKRGMTI